MKPSFNSRRAIVCGAAPRSQASSSLLAFIFFTCGAGLIAAEKPEKEAQDALKEAQFFFGQSSGVLDDSTRAALRRFQIRRGLPVTGEIDNATMQALKVNVDGVQSEVQAPPRQSAVPIRAQTTVEKDREFLQQIESGSGQMAVEARAMPAQPLPPSPTIQFEAPARPAPVVQSHAQNNRTPEKTRFANSRKVEAAPLRRGEASIARRTFAQETATEPPNRSEAVRLSKPSFRARNEDEDPDVLAPQGVKVTRTTTTTIGSDGRTYISEKKITTYPGTPMPTDRKGESVDSLPKDRGLFHRLFRED